MNRQILVATLPLVFVGCAQTSPVTASPKAGMAVPSVALPPGSKPADAVSERESFNSAAAPLPRENAPAEASSSSAVAAKGSAATIPGPATAVRQQAGSPLPADPAPVLSPTATSDPLLGKEPDVVPLPSTAPPTAAAKNPAPKTTTPSTGVTLLPPSN